MGDTVVLTRRTSRSKSGLAMPQLSFVPVQGRKVSRCFSLATHSGSEGRRKLSTMKPFRQYFDDRGIGAEGSAKKEGVSALLAAMSHFADCLELQVAGCKIVATRSNLCEGDQTALTVIDTTINAMKAFSSEETLVDWVLAALGKLLADDPLSKRSDRMASIGGVGLVMGVMDTFAAKPSIQARACNTLGHLAASEDLARAVSAAGGVKSSLAAMRDFPDDVAVQKNGCHAVANMAVEESVAKDVIANGGLPLILSAMKKYDDDSEMQDSACRAIGSLAACDDVCRQVGKEGSINAVIDAMKAHKESVGVQECGCWALVSMSEDCDNCSELVKAGALDLALYAMEMFYTGEALQEYGCRMLANMAMDDEMDASLTSEKVIESLLGAMERYTKNVEIQEHALYTLGRLILESDNVVQPVLKNDGIHLISEAMKVFNTNISILQGGCRAMGALAMQEEAREELSSGVGLDLVLSTIKRQDLEGNEVIQMLCCNTLASLIDTKNVKVKQKVCEEGGLSDMVRAIRMYMDDAELCECVCRAVSLLAGCSEVADNVECVGAFQSVLTAMEKHSDNAEVQESAVHALRYACVSGSISINALVSAISTGMRALPKDQIVQTNGSRLLAHIAVKDSNQLPIAKECGVKAVIEAMKNFPSDSAIQESCCRVLGLLSYNSETQQYVTGLGGIEATVAAMQHCGCVEVLIVGCGTLTCLAMTEKNVDRIRDIKGVQCVVSAMKKFKDHSSLQLTGCLALKMFSETREVAQQVVAEGGVTVIKDAMAKFPESTELAKEAQEALDNISKNSK